MDTYTMVFRSIDTNDILERDTFQAPSVGNAIRVVELNVAKGERWELRRGDVMIAVGIRRGYDS